MADKMEALCARLEAVAARLEKVAGSVGTGGAAPAAASGGSSEALSAFDDILNGDLKAFMDSSAGLGEEVAAMAPIVDRGFRALRDFLAVAATSKMPDQAGLMGLLTHMSAAITDAGTFAEKNGRSKQINHIKGVEAGLQTLSWVTMAPKPAPYIKETIGSAQFYTNRVLKDFKDKDEKQVAWAKAFVQLLNALHDYVKAHHTTGPTWNPNGGTATAPAAPKAAAAAPAVAAKPAAAPAGDSKGSLMASLTKGEGVTSGLKKVDKSQMVHKNPELRASSVVKAEEKPVAAAAPKAGAAAAVKKDPVFELQGKKWVVEHQVGNKDIVINDTELKQTVYIYKCDNSTIQIKGKVNSITCDGCKKTAVVFENCVAVFEFVNCQSMQAQVTGSVPTISIDKTDGAMVYLSPQCLDVEIVTAKSSEMNILVPQPNGDFTEMYVPEQFKTKINKTTGKLETSMTDIAG